MAEETTRDDAAEEAMNAVLAAEQEADRAIAACRERAERVLEEARARARHILERTDNRMTRLHEICGLDTRRRVNRLLAEEDRVRETISLRAGASEPLTKAVEELAERLTTTERSGVKDEEA